MYGTQLPTVPGRQATVPTKLVRVAIQRQVIAEHHSHDGACTVRTWFPRNRQVTGADRWRHRPRMGWCNSSLSVNNDPKYFGSKPARTGVRPLTGS
ncbi:uncharacterized protein LOC143203994 isoform X2 [Rhynchophorus ferrugineus]|uniref:uncharacterized protein LOC143203994 isoform X2 n=1 Tax=Rhynchophorus ferrugineus TaxID=354439 RepID=UPI003FCDF3B6